MAKRKKTKIKSIKLEYQKECISCGELFVTTSVSIQNICKKCVSFQKRSELKKRAVSYKGGSCIRCGYNKCDSSICFHHWIGWTEGHFTEEEKFKYKKSFSISSYSGNDWDKIKKELDKCIALCQNCHAELHAKMWFLKKEDLGLEKIDSAKKVVDKI